MKATFDWKYRSMTAFYTGCGQVYFNCDDEQDAQEIAIERAKKNVCASGLFHPSLVEISNLTISEE